MRVISGEAKGRPLEGPAGIFTRPMQDKIKAAVFSMLASLEVEFDRVADLYAGTGAIGIEAISRGARWCDFVDQNTAACAVIRRNVAKCGFADRSRVHQTTVATWVQRATEPCDLVIMDPPYADPEIVDILGKIAASQLVQSGTVVVIGHSPRITLPEDAGRLGRLRERCHGDSCFSIYEADLPPAGDAGKDDA